MVLEASGIDVRLVLETSKSHLTGLEWRLSTKGWDRLIRHSSITLPTGRSSLSFMNPPVHPLADRQGGVKKVPLS